LAFHYCFPLFSTLSKEESKQVQKAITSSSSVMPQTACIKPLHLVHLCAKVTVLLDIEHLLPEQQIPHGTLLLLGFTGK
jgi:hypothetical protein